MKAGKNGFWWIDMDPKAGINAGVLESALKGTGGLEKGRP